MLGLLIDQFVAKTEALIFGLDEMIEKRSGEKITARAIYRDPVRSISDCFQKTSGLRWLIVHLLASIL